MNKIALLNDNFRSTFLGGMIVMSVGVSELSLINKAEAILKVQRFSDFSQDNDPHGEHDFGSFEVAGERFFWKIDYYDVSLRRGAEDPTDPERTIRVLTIMLAEEY